MNKKRIIFTVLIILVIWFAFGKIVELRRTAEIEPEMPTSESISENLNQQEQKLKTPSLLSEKVDGDQIYEKINIIGETAKDGIYDPSVEYDENGVGWLAYSWFADDKERQGHLDTHLAKSTDNGKTWVYVNDINSYEEDTLTINNKPIEKLIGSESADGVWRHETTTLVYDSDDPNPEKRWKLFWVKAFSRQPYKNVSTDNNLFLGHSLIMYKYASAPEKLSEAKEIPLFKSNDYAPTAKYNLNKINPSSDNYFFFMEPGVFAKDGELYLALHGVSFPPLKPELFLISSKNHGETWKYVDELVTFTDVEELGFDEFTAFSMAEEKGRLFLLTSPIKKVRFPQHLEYNGIYIFEFEDISKGKLKRDSSGKLTVVKYIPPLSTKSVGGGQSDYHERNTNGGIIMAQSAPTEREPRERFQIYSTNENIVNEHDEIIRTSVKF